MATKKKATATKTKRPPKQVWLMLNPETGHVSLPCLKKAEAADIAERTGLAVAGPYVLVERVRQR